MLIKNAYIINADESVQADILIKDGIIARIDSTIKEAKDSGDIIDAQGLFVFPDGKGGKTIFADGKFNKENDKGKLLLNK